MALKEDAEKNSDCTICEEWTPLTQLHHLKLNQFFKASVPVSTWEVWTQLD